MNAARAKVAVIGAGDISERYVAGLSRSASLVPAAMVSRRPETSSTLAARYNMRSCSLEEALADPGIELVVNVTPAAVHGRINRAALNAGKSVYSEKPLAGTVDEARELAAIAREEGLLLAAAPATFLGPTLQQVRSMLDQGDLGKLVGGRLSMAYPGPDLWHHNADHLFGPLAGPLFDMGVYHLTALVALTGPIARVQALAGRASSHRTIHKGPRAGERFRVRTPTHWVINLDTESGAAFSAIFSFDAYSGGGAMLELHGSAGCLTVENPAVFVSKLRQSTGLFHWEDVEPDNANWSNDKWIVGIEEAWQAHRQGAEPRCSAELATHVLEVMLGIEAAASSGTIVAIHSRPPRPVPFAESPAIFAEAPDACRTGA